MSQSGSIEVKSTGGFSFKSSTSEPAKSGFTFGATSSGSKSDNASATGGFKLDSTSTPSTGLGSGFKFGGENGTKANEKAGGSGFVFGGSSKTSEDSNSSEQTTTVKPGGFTFGKLSDSSSDSKSGAPSLGASSEKTSSSVGGFVIGASVKTDEKDTSVPSGISFGKSSESENKTASLGGFSFGGKLESSKETVQTNSVTPMFGSKADSSSKSSDSNSQSSSNVGFGGFGSSSSVPASTASNGGFAFIATKITESSGASTKGTPFNILVFPM